MLCQTHPPFFVQFAAPTMYGDCGKRGPGQAPTQTAYMLPIVDTRSADADEEPGALQLATGSE